MTELPPNPEPFGRCLRILRCAQCPEFLVSPDKTGHGHCPYDMGNQRHRDEACNHLGEVACDEL